MGKKQKKRLKSKEKELDAFLKQFAGSATELEADRIHSLVNASIELKLGSALQRAKAMVALGQLEDAGFEMDKDDITLGIRWCVHNKTLPRAEETTVIVNQKDELAEIRERNRTRNLKAVGD